MLNSLLQQIKQRRLLLSLKQKDMQARIGISRQQYQHLEANGNPRLNTLELIAKGLNSQLMLIPEEKLNAVIAVLDTPAQQQTSKLQVQESLPDNPWQGLLGDE